MIDSTLALHLITLRGSVVIGSNVRDREETYWLDRAVEGDETAYRWLLSRYRDRVVRVAAATLGGTSEAEDAAQDAFIRAFRSLKKLDHRSSFYGWVCKITVRICLDVKRLKRTQDVRISEVDQESQCSNCSQATINGLLVWQVLNQLSAPMRAALVLRELDGLDYEEIADTLHIPVGTVRSRLNSARAQFKKLWEAACGDMEEISYGHD